MTIIELDQLLEDTRRMPRVEDRAGYNMTLAVIEIARQLILLNQKLGSGEPAKTNPKGKKKR